MLATRVLLAVLLAFGLLAPPARAGDATGATAPYEDVVEGLATLTWHLRDDLYRVPAPKDATGHDLYKLALTRLESWEKRFPGRMRDVTTLGRAEALEHLGEYRRAADAYGQVAAMAGSPLARKAREGAARARDFADAARLPEAGDSIQEELGALRRKLDAWGTLIEKYKDTPYESLALTEEERLERSTTRLVVEHRHEIEHGDETAEKALRFLIQKHADSKKLPVYGQRLGDLYAHLAREVVATTARPLALSQPELRARTDRALDTYHKVAVWDGVKENPEGQARFSAIEAWKTATLQHYR